MATGLRELGRKGLEPCSDDSNVPCLRSLAAFADLEFDLLALVKASIALTGDVGVVNEHVLAAVGGRDEPVPLLAVEKLDCASSH
jgi:hypothetical protein